MKKVRFNRIRELRERRGWTQPELAFRVGCSPPQISDLEIGKVKLTLEWMRRIALALNVAPGDILLPEDNPRFSDPKAAHFAGLYEQASADQREMLTRLAEAALGYAAPPAEPAAQLVDTARRENGR